VTDERKKSVQNQLQRLFDRSLVLRFQAGDDTALEEIVAEMHDRLRRFLRNSFCLHSADIDDLLQDVWVDACHGLRFLRQPVSLRPWLYRVARNKALKHLRRHTKMASLENLQIPTTPSSEVGASGLSHAEFQIALNCLSATHREVVVLRFEEGLNYDEIASAIQCPVGTVRSRLHYAKNILREKLRRFTNDDKC